MLVTLIGSPCSGKTTAAAVAFARLKALGLSVEFIPEQARRYIASERYRLQLPVTRSLKLAFADQLSIMREQVLAEQQMLFSCGPDVIVITDSSPLNALLYMTPAERADSLTLEQVSRAQSILRANSALTFVGAPILQSGSWDPLRVHDAAQSAVAAAQVDELVATYLTPIGIKPVTLFGLPESRGQTIAGLVLEQFLQTPPA